MFRAGIGESAAFGTAFSWGVSTHVHSAVGGMVGANAITLLRLPYQLFFLLILCLFLEGSAPAISWTGVLLICLSGFCGLMMSDLLLYRAIVLIGPQMGVLLQSVSSIFTALLGFLFLCETLDRQTLCGIVLVSIGVAMVLLEKHGRTVLPGQSAPDGRALASGAAMALGSAFFLACSFIIVKLVMSDGVSAIWVSVIRAFFAMGSLWIYGFFRGWVRVAIQGVRANHRIFWMLLASNSLSAMGLWLSTVALNNAPSGVATSIIGLQPIMVTIIGAVWYRKRPSLRVALGTCVAFGGTVLICLR